jgi:hypothetical protein
MYSDRKNRVHVHCRLKHSQGPLGCEEDPIARVKRKTAAQKSDLSGNSKRHHEGTEEIKINENK